MGLCHGGGCSGEGTGSAIGFRLWFFGDQPGTRGDCSVIVDRQRDRVHGEQLGDWLLPACSRHLEHWRIRHFSVANGNDLARGDSTDRHIRFRKKGSDCSVLPRFWFHHIRQRGLSGLPLMAWLLADSFDFYTAAADYTVGQWDGFTGGV